MKKINSPKQLNPAKFATIFQLDEILEAVNLQGTMLEAHAENPGVCPAVEGYAEAFDNVIDVVQKALETLAEQTEPIVADIIVSLESFRQSKLTAVANCTKADCPDKKDAQRDLGWVDGDQILQ